MRIAGLLPLGWLLLAAAQPGTAETPSGFEECFAQSQVADALCSRSGQSASTRLDCLEAARMSQQRCLEKVRAGMDLRAPPTRIVPTQPEPTPPVPSSQATTGEPAKGSTSSDLSAAAPAAPSHDPVTADPAIVHGEKVPGSEPVGKPDLIGSIAAGQSDWPSAAWVVSETTSPVDYSPLLVAEIHSGS